MNLKPGYYRKAWWAIVLIGSVAVGMLTQAAEFSDAQRGGAIAVWCFVLMAVWYAFNLHWMRRFMAYLRELEPLRKSDPDGYRSELQPLLQQRYSPQITAILQLSLANADCEQGDFEAANQCLQNIQPRKLHGLVRLCYWLNRTYILFHLGESAQAQQLWAEHKGQLERFANHAEWGFTVQTVQVMDLIASGKTEQARHLCARMQAQWKDQPCYDKKDMDWLQAML